MTNRLQGAKPTAKTRRLGHRARVLATTTFLAVAAPIAFVGAPVLAQSYSFQKVVIEGNERVEPETILGFAAIGKGQSLGAGALNDAYQRLQGSGLFQSVELIPRGATLTIKVQEFPTVNVVDFEGNKALKDEILSTVVKTQPRRIFSPALVEADAAAIAQGYAEAGRLNVRVDPKVIKRSGNRVDVVFEIKEGAVSEVNRITFTGNRSYSDRRLRDVLGTKQAGILHRLIQRDNFVADRVALDRQMLLDFYRSRGYPDVEVTGVSSEMTRDREGFFMTFNIREGQQYHFGTTTVVSEVSELDAADFEGLIKIRDGAIYSPAALDYAVTRMEEVALRQGANFVRVDPRITRDPRTQTLNVEFALVRGQRVFVERIDIEGNTTTLDSVVRREFNTVEGDPFNPREIRNSAERIRALGFFSKADVESRQGSSADQVVVDVNVEEQPTGSLSFGASYGASQGFGVNASLEESNFLGRGQYLGVSIGTTADNQSNSIDFIEPHLLGRDLKGRIRLWYNTSESDSTDFDTKMYGISPSIEFPIARNSRLELRYTWASNELSGVTSQADAVADADIDDNYWSSWALEQEEGKRDSSAIGYTYTYDTRRTGIDPRYGFTFRLSQDLYGLGGDVEALKTTALLRAERKVFHEDVILRAELEGGAIAARGGTALTILDRFSGNGKIRGFESYGYGPRDNAANNEDAMGGKYFAALRLESEFPVGLPEEYGIHGGLFFDAGSVWGLDNTGGGATGGNEIDDGFNLRTAVGFSVFWDSALGPLRLNFSKALQKEDYDLEQSFDLTISTKF
ncbi:Beta-barrel assembly machine subunit BamA [Rhodobacter aestuarii]|uniref:Outer membrane protein assembly factor BamA n=1 Tax=Rhodobacter aestuarii TaxID=453582 RepID=A0A1N7M396_9RHOB|nr:outer membrane protein assembly factor BamA [Rhodobacter aestuarii]PTV94816.1 Beta-barrel assembly machine subunit BamA [Rhodobacter aestuarii]SIS80557.1 Beta-barrel assembly machine subunit BamA [Rhodobacter aestuarii]